MSYSNWNSWGAQKWDTQNSGGGGHKQKAWTDDKYSTSDWKTAKYDDWGKSKGDRDGWETKGDRDGWQTKGDRDGWETKGDRDGWQTRYSGHAAGRGGRSGGGRREELSGSARARGTRRGGDSIHKASYRNESRRTGARGGSGKRGGRRLREARERRQGEPGTKMVYCGGGVLASIKWHSLLVPEGLSLFLPYRLGLPFPRQWVEYPEEDFSAKLSEFSFLTAEQKEKCLKVHRSLMADKSSLPVQMQLQNIRDLTERWPREKCPVLGCGKGVSGLSELRQHVLDEHFLSPQGDFLQIVEDNKFRRSFEESVNSFAAKQKRLRRECEKKTEATVMETPAEAPQEPKECDNKKAEASATTQDVLPATDDHTQESKKEVEVSEQNQPGAEQEEVEEAHDAAESMEDDEDEVAPSEE